MQGRERVSDRSCSSSRPLCSDNGCSSRRAARSTGPASAARGSGPPCARRRASYRKSPTCATAARTAGRGRTVRRRYPRVARVPASSGAPPVQARRHTWAHGIQCTACPAPPSTVPATRLDRAGAWAACGASQLALIVRLGGGAALAQGRGVGLGCAALTLIGLSDVDHGGSVRCAGGESGVGRGGRIGWRRGSKQARRRGFRADNDRRRRGRRERRAAWGR